MGDMKELFTRVLDTPEPPMTRSVDLLATARGIARRRRMLRAGSLAVVSALVMTLGIAVGPTILGAGGDHRRTGVAASPVVSDVPTSPPGGPTPAPHTTWTACAMVMAMGDPVQACTRVEVCPKYNKGIEWCELVSEQERARAANLRSALILGVPADYPTYLVIPADPGLGPRVMRNRSGGVRRSAGLAVRRGDEISYVFVTVSPSGAGFDAPIASLCEETTRETWLKEGGCRITVTQPVRVRYAWAVSGSVSPVAFTSAYTLDSTVTVTEWATSTPLLGEQRLAELAIKLWRDRSR
jgi:hypothetical protein